MEYDENKYPFIWKRVSRRGYCFTARIPCRVIGASKQRIEIAASLVDGSERIHRIAKESLEHSPCHCFAGCVGLELALKNLPSQR